MRQRLRLFIAAALTACALLAAAPARADMNVIRDDETEAVLRSFAIPIWQQAGLSPSTVRIIMINDNALNAFVAGGQNIFINTGLLLQVKNPAELIGVIAHESGHIACGHLARMASAMEDRSLQAMIGQLIGIAVAIGAKAGDAGMAISAASQTAALRGILSHSRAQESAADEAGVRFLEGAGLPVGGFLSFMQQLESQELLPESQQSEYVRTHPLSQDRVDFLQHALDSEAKDGKTPPEWDGKLKRIQAKLQGYLFPERALLSRGDDTDTLYGRSIALERRGDFGQALPIVDRLIAAEPANPYFQELKGQMLYESGRVNDALGPYAKAVAGAPKAALIATAYGQALLEAKPPQLDAAVAQFTRSLQIEPKSSGTHYLLALAYGRQGQEGLSRLHLAEQALLQGKYDNARTEANLALNALPPKGASRQRALDILDAAQSGADRKKDRDR